MAISATSVASEREAGTRSQTWSNEQRAGQHQQVDEGAEQGYRGEQPPALARSSADLRGAAGVSIPERPRCHRLSPVGRISGTLLIRAHEAKRKRSSG